MAGIALATWRSTFIVPDATFGYFAMIRIYQMLALPFLFIPINTIAYEQLPPDKTNQGSALINVARNLGSGVGISLANTQLLQRSRFHQARLVSNVVPSSPAWQSALQGLTHYFISRRTAPRQARRNRVPSPISAK